MSHEESSRADAAVKSLGHAREGLKASFEALTDVLLTSPDREEIASILFLVEASTAKVGSAIARETARRDAAELAARST